MFTEEQLDVAYKNLKGGEKFSDYVKNVASMGVVKFTFYLSDGAGVYHSDGDYYVDTKAVYKELTINQVFSEKQVKHAIKEYHEANTDFVTFCHQLSDAGVYKFMCNTENGDLTFSDKEEANMCPANVSEV